VLALVGLAALLAGSVQAAPPKPGATFSPAGLPVEPILTDPADLAAVAAGTASYLRLHAPLGDDPSVGPGLFADLGVDLDRVIRTLDFVVRVAAEDTGSAHQRLQDPAFIAQHFAFLAWSSDTASAAVRGLDLPADQIRLTRYLVYRVDGRDQPDGTYAFALYAPPVSCSPDTYTRQQVMAGVYGPGGQAEGQAMVFLTRQGVLDALLQGTVQVQLADGQTRLFNVAVNNGRPYQPTLHDPGAQPRYWYFKQVGEVQGWGQIPLRPGATVAGDIHSLGLGKLIALETRGPDGGPALRLVVLSDTGGAFADNLFQLDYLAGTFPDRASLDAATRDLPGTVRAGVLLLRE